MIIKKAPTKDKTDMKHPDMSGVSISTKVVATVNKPITNGKKEIISFIGIDSNFPDIEKIDIGSLRMGVNKNILVSSFYIDSNGDLIKKGICEGTVITEFEYSLDNFNTICGTYDNNNDDEYYTEEKSVISRAPKAKITDDMVELCEVSLGTWRNYIQKLDNNSTFIGKRIYYDKSTNLRKDKDNGNTIYATIIICKTDIKDNAILELKQMLKENNLSVNEWL